MSSLSAGFAVIVANMTGHERATLGNISASRGLNIVLNLALIPVFGMDDSAIPTGTSLFTFDMLQWVQVRRRFVHAPSVLGF